MTNYLYPAPETVALVADISYLSGAHECVDCGDESDTGDMLGVFVCSECLKAIDASPDPEAAMTALLAQVCPAGWVHTWNWHNADSDGPDCSPGVYCDECMEPHPEFDKFPAPRFWDNRNV